MPNDCNRPRISAPRCPVLRRQPVAQRPVGEAQLEAVDDLRRLKAARGQVLHRLPATVSASRCSSPITCNSSIRSSASRATGGGSLRTVPCLTGWIGSAAKGRWSARSNSTAWRKLTPLARITQSMAVPPTLQAPRQCHRFFAGVMTSDGVRSSWKGHLPRRSAPCRVSLIPRASASR